MQCHSRWFARWKIWTEDKSKTDATKTKHNPEKANNTKHSKTKPASFSIFLYDTWPVNDCGLNGLFYNAAEPTEEYWTKTDSLLVWLIVKRSCWFSISFWTSSDIDWETGESVLNGDVRREALNMTKQSKRQICRDCVDSQKLSNTDIKSREIGRNTSFVVQNEIFLVLVSL